MKYNIYKTNEAVQHFAGMLDGLAFLRPTDVPEGIAYLQENIPNFPRMEELFVYFDTCYCRGPFVNNNDNNNHNNRLHLIRRQPLYPPQLWNVHSSTLTNLDRTNNACEGWNNSFYNLIGHQNPSILTTLKAFQNDAAINKAKIIQMNSGQPIQKDYRKLSK